MENITKRQHYVPTFYLDFWKNPKCDNIYLYDFQEHKVFPTKPESVLVEKYYYEANRLRPDNEVETLLSKIESKVAPILASLRDVLEKNCRWSEEERSLVELKRILNADAQDALREFAAYQYLRVPGAIEQRAFELRPSGMPADTLEQHLKPGNFVKTGFDYIRDRFFNNLGMLISFSAGYEFVTADWPCFDLMHSKFAPALGQEIGANPGVFLIFPLLPRALLTLFPTNHFPHFTLPNRLLVRSTNDGNVKNTNALIIQQARRWVVWKRDQQFIWEVAAKRKR